MRNKKTAHRVVAFLEEQKSKWERGRYPDAFLDELLFIVQGYSLAMLGEPLFEEDFFLDENGILFLQKTTGDFEPLTEVERNFIERVLKEHFMKDDWFSSIAILKIMASLRQELEFEVKKRGFLFFKRKRKFNKTDIKNAFVRFILKNSLIPSERVSAGY
ncbi:hypothetical protein [Massilibacteroides sp.]|uniref:hypothetical protein n=1 Tax=Massilibacteroides sp. TaxID=2034766 RepID=UPI00261EEAF3|nr:hypothetical protein [Massilibacteroides sp.]MDD4516561.1 hypothetical protein [Massilibacteroides sp.]